MGTQFRNLQGLRGIACLLVLGIHTAGWEANFGIAREFLRPFLWFGYGGVDLFFVISGFIIAYTQAGSFGKPTAIPRYLVRRAWRIYPAFWAMMLIAVPLTNTVLAPFPGAPWFSWLTLTPHAFPNGYLPPAWTMNYELCFYAAFATLMLLPRRIAPLPLLAWAAVVVWVEAVKADDSFYAATFAATFSSPLILEFLLGVCVAAGVRRGFAGWGRTAIAVGIVWAACGIVLCHPGGVPYALGMKVMARAFVFGPASALLVYGVIAAEKSGTLKFPKWLCATGDASYSIYLWHAPIGICLHCSILWWPHHTAPHLAWIALMLAVCWGGGMLFHRLVERPLLNLAKRKPKAAAPSEPEIVEARIAVPLLHEERQLLEFGLRALGNRAEHVDLERLPHAVPADVLQPPVDDELIFPGYPELGSRSDFDAGLSRVDGDRH